MQSSSHAKTVNAAPDPGLDGTLEKVNAEQRLLNISRWLLMSKASNCPLPHRGTPPNDRLADRAPRAYIVFP